MAKKKAEAKKANPKDHKKDKVPNAAPKKPLKVLKKPADFHGVTGVTKRKQREAVEGLVLLLSELGAVKAGTEVKVYGTVGEIEFAAPDGKKVKSEAWEVSELSFFTPTGAFSGSGSSVMVSDPESMGLIAAAEDYLANFHTKPVVDKKTKKVVDDVKAEAEWRLRHLWHLPSGSDAREFAAYALWYSQKYGDTKSFQEFFKSRPTGFYGTTVQQNVVAAVGTDNDAIQKLHEKYDRCLLIEPNRVFELRLRGWKEHVADELGRAGNPLVKVVSAKAATMDRWLKENPVLADALEEPPVDLARVELDAGRPEEAEKILRDFGGNDLILSGSPDKPIRVDDHRMSQVENVPEEWAKLAKPVEVAVVESSSGESADDGESAPPASE